MDANQRSTTEVEALYRQHGPALLIFATSLAGNRASGQDAVHQVFLRLIEKGSLSHAADKKAYLFASVRNAVLSGHRAKQRTVSLEPDTAWFTCQHRDFAEEASLRRGLISLPEEQREVVVLHIWGELTFAQIAELIGVSSNTVTSRYRYALAKLKDSMLMKEDSHAGPGR